MERSFYTCEEVAELMRMRITTIRTYCKEGKIPSIKIGRSYHISAKDFEEWCMQMKQLPRGTEIKKYLTKLKESETKYKNLINQSLDGIVMTDFKSTLLVVNPGFCGMLGCSEEELLGTNFSQHVHPDERAKAVEDHMHRIAGEVDKEPKTVRLLRKDGKTVITEILGGPVWESDDVAGVQKIIRDITARSRLEQELEALLELIPDALMITDSKGKIYRVNARVEELSGYKREELFNMERVVNMYYYPEEREKALALLKEKGEFHNFEFTARLKGDVAMPAEMSAQIAEINGETYIESLVRDVTERKRLQDELKQAKDALERTFNAANFGIARLDTNLRVLFVNNWLKKRIPGITPGKTCHIPFEEGEGLCPWCPSVKCLKSGKPEKAETTVKRPDGTVHKLRLLAYPIADEAGHLVQITEVIMDLSEKQEPGWDVIKF